MDRDEGRDERVGRAVALSMFSAFPAEALERLLRGARPVVIPAGSTLFLGARAPQPALVVEGLLRVYIASLEGKQVTISYVKAGGCVGVAALVGGPPPVTIQALTASSILVFDPDTLRAVAMADAAAGWAISQELTRLILGLLDELATNVFGTVRQRIGSHLLSLAAPDDQGRLVVPSLTHQELANAIGTAREVASRTLAELVRARLVTASKDGLVLDDPERLLAESSITPPA